MDAGSEGRLHVIVFPWLAFGHMIPFLELAKALARTGHLVSFLGTPRNLRRLPKVPPSLSPLINLVGFPLPPTEGLPEDAESTLDLAAERVQYLKKAFDTLEAPVAEFIAAAAPPVDWVVHDFAQHWISGAAARDGVPRAFYSVCSPWLHGFLGPPATYSAGEEFWRTPESFMTPPRWADFAPWLVFRRHEASTLAAYQLLPNATGISDLRRFGLAIEGCGVVLLRSCEELEPEWLALIRDLYGKPVVPLGHLPASEGERVDGDELAGSGVFRGAWDVFEWLGKKGAGSVVYVAFGSEADLSPELTHELALGLEQSQLPFLWALRKPPGSADGADLLPPGFQDRTGGRGVVTTSWIPQIKVLAHPSVWAFLTHSGWSSVIEGIAFGRPLVLLPLISDQCLIARAMAEWKVGVEVPRAEEDGAFTRDGVAGSLRRVMAGDDGRGEAAGFRANARRAGEVFGDEDLHDRCIDNLVRCLVARVRTP